MIPFLVFGQTENLDPNSGNTEEISKIIKSIPPLQVLIDSAIINSPYIKFQNAEIMRSQFNIRIAKSNWTKNMGMTGDLVYGSYDYLSLNPNTGVSTINSQVQTRFGTGVYFRLPLYDAINRKNEVRIAEIELDEAKFVKEQKILELRQLVIAQYNTVVLKERLLRILSNNEQSTSLQVKMIEKQFTNGNATIEELARLTEIYNNSIINNETAKVELTVAYLILQELVGIKFNIN